MHRTETIPFIYNNKYCPQTNIHLVLPLGETHNRLETFLRVTLAGRDGFDIDEQLSKSMCLKQLGLVQQALVPALSAPVLLRLQQRENSTYTAFDLSSRILACTTAVCARPLPRTSASRLARARLCSLISSFNICSRQHIVLRRCLILNSRPAVRQLACVLGRTEVDAGALLPVGPPR